DPAVAAVVPASSGKDGKLTVATTAGSIPLSLPATDNKTSIGGEVDSAQLVADKPGPQLDVQVTCWAHWPLKTQSGDFEGVAANLRHCRSTTPPTPTPSWRSPPAGQT